MFFEQVLEGVPDPIFGRLAAFKADPRPNKMSLVIGIYKDENLEGHLIGAVQKGKKRVESIEGLADYLPIDGLAEFYGQVGQLCFGSALWSEHHGRIYAAQTPGGTGALRILAEFLKQEIGPHFSIPHPTWPNHRAVFERANCSVQILPYYSHELHSFDRVAYFNKLRSLPPKTVVLLHSACHNPTGSDPSIEDWSEISDVCKERSLIPFFDFAYQGFGKGIEEDAKATRLFLERGHEMVVAYSCSKNFSLYCERVGALFIVGPNSAAKQRIGSQIKRIIRALYSNPPAHGAQIAAAVLKDPMLTREWVSQLDEMRNRITAIRHELVSRLNERSKVDFRFILDHKGMFSYLDLTESQVGRLMSEYGIYTLDSGRINVAGLNQKNLDYFVDSLIEVCES